MLDNLEKSFINKYGASLVKCISCKRSHVMGYPMPIRMPSECPYCGNMTCYFMEEKNDD